MCYVVGGKLEIWRKIPRSKAGTNNKLKPPMTAGPGVILRPHWWEASAFTTITTQLLFWSGFKVDFDTCSLLHTHISAMRNMKPCSHFVSDNYTYLMVCRSVFKKAFGKEAVNDNDEEFVDPLPEKLRATVVLWQYQSFVCQLIIIVNFVRIGLFSFEETM